MSKNVFPKGAGLSIVNLQSGEVEHGVVTQQFINGFGRFTGINIRFDSGHNQEIERGFLENAELDFDPRKLKYGPSVD